MCQLPNLQASSRRIPTSPPVLSSRVQDPCCGRSTLESSSQPRPHTALPLWKGLYLGALRQNHRRRRRFQDRQRQHRSDQKYDPPNQKGRIIVRGGAGGR